MHALPDVAIDIEPTTDSVTDGDTIVYAINYSNIGPVNATGVELTFHLPRGTELNEDETSEGWTCKNRRCKLIIGQLDVGSTGAATIAVTVSNGNRRRLSAWATISDDGEHGRDGNRRNNFAFVRTDMQADADG